MLSDLNNKTKLKISYAKAIFYTITIGYALISIFPFIWSFYASLRPAGDVFKFTLDFSNLSFNNYIEMAQSHPIWKWYINSIIVAVVVTVGNVYINAMAGYALARIDFPGKNILFLTIIGIMMIPGQVTMIPTFMLLTKLGLVNTLAGLSIPFLFSSFNTFLMRQFFLAIPTSIEEAAEIDGLSRIKIFFKIAMPLAKAPILTLIILTFMGNWNSFLWPSLLSSSQDIYTLPVGLSTLSNQYYSFPHQVMAGAMFLTIPMIIVYFIFQRQFMDGFANTGNKE
ncbi:carbohydrate ABC transporter permease [Lederbergia citri]|uniref:Carbohydrate ABC transporter permease n=1 Tax=Lederbergia citri TaxID=2833580 RepID=A0A942T9P1_9BACI|nr:carbohydrate ABC transporter permease [Lederbergia citri]MBS4193750.1 carbohydrate ABC transporter permease [Lederbergia citri]